MNDHGDGGVDLTGGWYDGMISNMSLLLSICMFDKKHSPCVKCTCMFMYVDDQTRYVLSTAGDHVKFNLPMAFSAHVLAYGLNRWKDGYEAANQLQNMYDMLRTPLDYFMKCWRPQSQEYYAQVFMHFRYILKNICISNLTVRVKELITSNSCFIFKNSTA